MKLQTEDPNRQLTHATLTSHPRNHGFEFWRYTETTHGINEKDKDIILRTPDSVRDHYISHCYRPQTLYCKHVPETHQFEAVAVSCTVRFTEVQTVDLSCRAITKNQLRRQSQCSALVLPDIRSVQTTDVLCCHLQNVTVSLKWFMVRAAEGP